MRRLVSLAGFVCVAAAVLSAPRAKAVACTADEGDDGVPYEVFAGGVVSEISGRHFKIGEVDFELPTSRSRLTWCLDHADLDLDLANYARFKVGDYVGTGGTLRADGSVLAYWTQQSAPEYDATIGAPASGVVESVVVDDRDLPVSFVMNGIRYSVDPDVVEFENAHPGLAATDPIDGNDISLNAVAAGDAVFLNYWVDDSGVRETTYVYVRMSGSETRVAGTITAVWNGETEFAVDGVPAVCDQATQLVFHDPADRGGDEQYDAANFGGLREGQIVDVTGVLRDGVVFADRLVVVREPESAGAKRLARRAGRLRAHGVVDGVRAGGVVVVSGLAVRTRGRTTRSLLKSASAASARRVSVAASVRGGVVSASAIRGR